MDPYGDTYFNRMQMPHLLEELDRAKQGARNEEDREQLARVEELAKRCADQVHTYIRFVGD